MTRSWSTVQPVARAGRRINGTSSPLMSRSSFDSSRWSSQRPTSHVPDARSAADASPALPVELLAYRLNREVRARVQGANQRGVPRSVPVPDGIAKHRFSMERRQQPRLNTVGSMADWPTSLPVVRTRTAGREAAVGARLHLGRGIYGVLDSHVPRSNSRGHGIRQQARSPLEPGRDSALAVWRKPAFNSSPLLRTPLLHTRQRRWVNLTDLHRSRYGLLTRREATRKGLPGRGREDTCLIR
jgi:hypothetical protein